jgi:transcriptional regulator GlxA family with amidase domain
LFRSTLVSHAKFSDACTSAENEVATPVSGSVLDALRTAWANGARLASICTGAFVLAQTGLLDGQRATTHWLATAEFARRFPLVPLDPDVLFVDGGRIVTSAGALAGLDMCLHLVRQDYGQAAAAHAARLAVAPLNRDGGQAQFIRHDLPSAGDSMAPLLDWMVKHLDRPLDVATLAAKAGTSPRTFARRFREQTGTTPLQWLLAARVRRAQELLEIGGRTIGEVATASGFEAIVTFRNRFQQIVGVGPAAYRRRFAGDRGHPS